MPFWVVDGAVIACTMGMAPATLGVPPRHGVTLEHKGKATIMDHKPMVNIRPFGACMSPANPQVAAATAAALGVLTPQPCQPMTQTPWMPGNRAVRIAQEPGLDDTCTCQCLWGGTISVVFAGQVSNPVP
ncbi:DUF4280 domain-containing protein [Falsiroseomonas oryzae]|uniref:DUF4280 domain-containing protein n=1 Tax=Falsiroseomonas oryzae TaxID=2766473 RepID=UPI0022EB9673|nr:DUF4280 domain-containing protein [Roseomonas sp. MO-31]